MTTINILTIDSDENYQATLHTNVGDLADTLNDWTQAYGYDHQLEDTDEIVEWLQDHGVEVNITEADLPGAYVDLETLAAAAEWWADRVDLSENDESNDKRWSSSDDRATSIAQTIAALNPTEEV